MIQIGQNLGKYEILSKLGEGGMGEVYLATDTKLDRNVAIKVLPEAFSSDSISLQRFMREAKVLASLNHSNIAAIYGFEECDELSYIVLEYVEGETMMQRLLHGPIELNKSLEYAKQLCEALEVAHSNNVIHRDLKPGNVMFNSDDSVKVLDFGLARSNSKDDTKPSADAPTMTPGQNRKDTLTTPGMLMGTAGYMSPEQANGEKVDHRSDIFSFGCILFEMLTGKRTFSGKTVYDSVASTLNDEPEWSLLPSNTPKTIRTLLRRCLAKNPKQRLQAIGDARLELAETLEVPDDSHVAQEKAEGVPWVWVVLPWLVCGGLAIAWAMQPPAQIQMEKRAKEDFGSESWEISLPENTSMGWSDTSNTWSKVGFSRLIAVSRDGRRIIQTVRKDGDASLFIKDDNQFSIKEVSGTENARGPFFSPDGQWVAFDSEGTLQKVRLPDGGTPELLCSVNSNAFDGTWLEDNSIIFSTDRGIFRVSALGGEPEQLTTLKIKDGERGHHFPHALPGEKSILFTLVLESGQHAAILSLTDNTWKLLKQNAADARFDPAGYLLFARDGEILAAQYDPEKPFEVGVAQPIVQRVHTTSGHGGAVVTHFATSDNGMLAFAPPVPAHHEDSLVWVDHEGNEELIVSGPGQWMHQRLSPLGDRILYNIQSEQGMLDLHIYDIEKQISEQLTRNGASYDAEWGPKGEHIIFGSVDMFGRSICSIPANFGAPPMKIAEGKRGSRPHVSDWTQDGSEVLFFDRRSGGIWLTDPRGRKPKEILHTELNERWARISPNGRMIAYVGGKSHQRREVYIQPYPEFGERIRVSVKGGGEPLWSHDSKTLFFRQDDAVYASEITFDTDLHAATPTKLFSGKYDQALAGHQHFDRSLDSEKFLMVKHGERTRPTSVNVTSNWKSQLTQQKPGD